MAIDYTVDSLIEQVRNKGSLTSGGEQLSDDQIAQELSDTLITYLAPLITSQAQEYMVSIYDQDVVVGQTSYDIPERAMATALRDICYVDTAGNEYNIPRISPDQLKNNPWSNQNPLLTWGYYFQADKVVIYTGVGPNNPAVQYATLRMKYFRRPNNIVAVDQCGKVLSINGNVVTVDNVPTTWTTSDTFDLIKGTPQFGSKKDDATVTAINGFDLTFTDGDVPDDLAVGDWVCIAGTAPVAQVPYDAYNLLAQATAADILQYLAYPDAAAAQASANRLEKKLVGTLTPRNIGTPEYIVPRLW